MKYFVKFLCKYDIVNTHIFKFFLFFIVIGLSFISKAQFFQNKGQLDPQIYYTKPIFSGSLLVSENGLNYLFYDDQHLQKLYEISHHLKDLPEEELKRKKSNVSAGLKMKYHNIAQEFIGAKIIKANILEEKAQESYYNYFIGNDPEKWASDVKAFYTLRIKDLYPGID